MSTSRIASFPRCSFRSWAVDCAFVTPELQTMFLKRLFEFGHDKRCLLCRRSYRDVVKVCPVFQFGGELALQLSRLIFAICERHPQGQSKRHRRLACALQKTISHHDRPATFWCVRRRYWLYFFLFLPTSWQRCFPTPRTIVWLLPRRRHVSQRQTRS